MNCTFCGQETNQSYKQGKLIIIAHFWCLEDRLTQLDTEKYEECLKYEELMIRG